MSGIWILYSEVESEPHFSAWAKTKKSALAWVISFMAIDSKITINTDDSIVAENPFGNFTHAKRVKTQWK
jgi:hypothetical protein